MPFAVVPAVEGRQVIFPEAVPQFEEDVEQPGAVGVEEGAGEDHHVEHVTPGAPDGFVKEGNIVRALFLKDFPCFVQLEGMVCVGIMAVKGFDPVAALLGNEGFDFS